MFRRCFLCSLDPDQESPRQARSHYPAAHPAQWALPPRHGSWEEGAGLTHRLGPSKEDTENLETYKKEQNKITRQRQHINLNYLHTPAATFQNSITAANREENT